MMLSKAYIYRDSHLCIFRLDSCENILQIFCSHRQINKYDFMTHKHNWDLNSMNDLPVFYVYFSGCVFFPTGPEFSFGTADLPSGQPGSSKRSGCPWPRFTPRHSACPPAITWQLRRTGAHKDTL